MQTRGCSCSGHRSEKTIDQHQQCERHKPAVGGGSRDLIWSEGGRRGVGEKCRHMAQKVEREDHNVPPYQRNRDQSGRSVNAVGVAGRQKNKTKQNK